MSAGCCAQRGSRCGRPGGFEQRFGQHAAAAPRTWIARSSSSPRAPPCRCRRQLPLLVGSLDTQPLLPRPLLLAPARLSSPSAVAACAAAPLLTHRRGCHATQLLQLQLPAAALLARPLGCGAAAAPSAAAACCAAAAAARRAAPPPAASSAASGRCIGGSRPVVRVLRRLLRTASSLRATGSDQTRSQACHSVRGPCWGSLLVARVCMHAHQRNTALNTWA